ncbi:hypothetical protein SeMB42_g04383 [Synchytrium endobioticum]|uniref:ABC1 atypical kinase-like domain-containing protein n=1 Tax=Synchytrium endobioticum TaxID=286115 RepID=A0A507D2W7_9FUNG|nr:hypothetical protein SeMB42_g04383 [Synchytrium endobioticum]TPX45849.1 hypothetical protein SeLEV6574_g03621 [Synchytrium endobioticum]
MVRSAATVGAIAMDYKISLRNPPEAIGKDEYNARKSACHQRSADRLLELCKLNGGIFVKLGQHIAAMVYLLPLEYTATMRVLWDQCTPTCLPDIEKLLVTDANATLADLFQHFDPKPLGVASIAQVHKAVLKNGQAVAVKLQHLALDEHAKVDTKTVVALVKFIKWAFPEFEFGWLADELRDALPLELDFRNEAANAEKVRRNFVGNPILHIPHVYDAKRRILIMEFIEGAKVDDLDYLKKYHISPRHVSVELNKIFSEMTFLHGFVHCDPHSSNVFIRYRPTPSFWTRWFSPGPINPYRFELVLLDHGLYKTIKRDFRLCYARLWDALIRADEQGIADESYELFKSDLRDRVKHDGIDRHRLLASMLTGRSWEALSTGAMAKLRSAEEMNVIRSKALQGPFFIAIAEILAQVPRELLLLLKTADLLRAVDESLGVGGKHGDEDHMMRMVSIMGVYTSRAIFEDAMSSLPFTTSFLPMSKYLDNRFYQIWMRYLSAITRLYIVRMYLTVKRVRALLFG